jgi:ATP-dependent exoDNAse (exonuclease V) beta subunit
MTRARDRLYLTSAGEPEATLGSLDPAALRTARNAAAWLRSPLAQDGLPVRVEIWRDEAEMDAASPQPAPEASASLDRAALRQAFRALPDRGQAPPLPPPMRLSASALAEAGEGYGAILRERRRGGQSRGAARDAGVLTHRLLELIDLRDPPGDLAATLEELILRGALPTAARDAIDLAAIGRFLSSDTARRIAGAKRIERELAFSVLADPSGRPVPGGGSLLQGRIDLLLQDEQGWLIVDFKTDHVAPAQVPQAVQAYLGQVEAYRRALRVIAGIEADAVLYFLRPGIAAAVPSLAP